MTGIRRALFGPVSPVIVDQDGSYWVLQDVRFYSRQIYCTSEFVGWVNLSRLFKDNITEVSTSQATTLIIAGGQLYSCGALFGTSKYMLVVKQNYSNVQSIASGVDASYILLPQSLVVIRTTQEQQYNFT